MTTPALATQDTAALTPRRAPRRAPLRSALAVAAVVGLAAAPLAGCQSVEERTGVSTEAQGGALGGAAIGGVVAGLAGAHPGWIAASTILGGIAGGALSEFMTSDNAERHAENNVSALNTLGPGQSTSWSDPQSNASGMTTVNSVYTANGRTCKTFTETVRTPERTVTQDGTACRQADGTWQVQTA